MMQLVESDLIAPLASALAAGLLVGIERGWKLREMPDGSRVAGVRTFTLLGLVAGLSGVLAMKGYYIVAAAIFLAPALVIAAGYIYDAQRKARVDATSAIAAFVVLALGFLGGSGAPGLAVGGAAIVMLILAQRKALHHLVSALDPEDLKALARYSVIALAVFPFLPAGRFGPYDAWDARTLWFVVVLVTGFSFLGYVANRVFGASRGTIATAMIGGAYSSTAVTQSLSQRLGSGHGGGAENAGIAIASAVMYVRVIVLVAALATYLLIPFAILVVPALIAGAAAGWWLYRKSDHSPHPVAPGNPIELLPALSFALFVAIAALAARWAEASFGEQGIAVLLFVMGSMDVDASIVTAGGLEPGMIDPSLGALAIAGTIFANMLVKLLIVLVYGRKAARPAAYALAASMAVLLLSLGIGAARL